MGTQDPHKRKRLSIYQLTAQQLQNSASWTRSFESCDYSLVYAHSMLIPILQVSFRGIGYVMSSLLE